MIVSSGNKLSKAARWGTGFIVLALPPLFWAGNFVVGRAARSDIPPMTLAFGRWVIALACLLPFAWPAIRRDFPKYWQYRSQLLRVSLVGVAAFNTLAYVGLQSTTASNVLLLNSFVPVLIALFAALFYGQRLRPLQMAGLVISCIGVLAIILQGDWGRLTAMQFSHGDLIAFVAMMCWAIYTLWLRDFPSDIDRLGLLAAQMFIGLIMLAPFFLWDYASGHRPTWNATSIYALLYVGIFPSVLAYSLYMRGIAQVGAARAGLFIHLVPVYGSLLAVLLLGEHLHAYHAAGIGAILLGLVLSSRGAGRLASIPPPVRKHSVY